MEGTIERPAAPSAALPQRVWRGELPLWAAYWLFGVGGNMSFALLLWRVAARTRGVAPWLVYFGSLAWFVLIFRGIWRSAGCYAGPPLWPGLARAGVLLGVPRLLVEAFLLLNSGGGDGASPGRHAARISRTGPRIPLP